MSKKIISIVISAYNEESNIAELYKELNINTKQNKDIGTKYQFEYVFVNDGSNDDTLRKLKQLQKQDSDIRIVSLKRNFGHEIAMTAGMDHALGDAVIFMDADLQHPPAYIPKMVDLWASGAEIVLSHRTENLDTSYIYKFSALLFYKILNWLSDTKIPAKSPDFRLLDRRYVDFLKGFNEHDRLFRGLLSWIMPTDKVKTIDFVAPKRFSGKSKYNVFKSFTLAIDSIIQSSNSTFESVVSSMNSAGQSWASQTESSYSPQSFTPMSKTIDAGVIMENIGGVRGIDKEAAQGVASKLPSLASEANQALSNAQSAVQNSGFIGGSQQANLVDSLGQIKTKIDEIVNNITNETKTAVDQTVEAYGDLEGKVSQAFTIQG